MHASLLEARSTWLVSPLLDILFVCGGLLWLLVLIQNQLHHALPSMDQSILFAIAMVGSHAFSDGHIAATLTKLAADKKRSLVSTATVTIPLAIAASVLFCGLFVHDSLPILLRCYLALAVHHYCRQTYGLALIYCYRSRYQISPGTKIALSAFLDSVAAISIIRTFREPGLLPEYMLGTRIPFWGPISAELFVSQVILLVATTAAFLFFLLRTHSKNKRAFPLPAMLLVLTITGLLLSDGNTNQSLWLLAPAFFHGSQYLLLIFSLGPNVNGARVDSQGTWVGEYACNLMFIALTLYFGVPLALSKLGFSSGVATLATFCAVSVHHFLTDALIWKGQKRRIPC